MAEVVAQPCLFEDIDFIFDRSMLLSSRIENEATNIKQYTETIVDSCALEYIYAPNTVSHMPFTLMFICYGQTEASA